MNEKKEDVTMETADTENKIEETQNDRLLRKIYETYNSRYSASRRFENKSKMQNITSYITGSYVTVASALLLAPSIFSPIQKNNLNFIILGLSIISLALSIYYGNQESLIKSKDFHRCARELQRLYEDLYSEKESFDYKQAETRYNNILDSYNFNHDFIDFDYTKHDKEYRKYKEINKKEQKKKDRKFKSYCRKYWLKNNWHYLILWFLPIIISIAFIAFFSSKDSELIYKVMLVN